MWQASLVTLYTLPRCKSSHDRQQVRMISSILSATIQVDVFEHDLPSTTNKERIRMIENRYSKNIEGYESCAQFPIFKKQTYGKWLLVLEETHLNNILTIITYGTFLQLLTAIIIINKSEQGICNASATLFPVSFHTHLHVSDRGKIFPFVFLRPF